MPTGLYSAMYTTLRDPDVPRARTSLPSAHQLAAAQFERDFDGFAVDRTRPAAMSSSASRREHRPDSLMYLLRRMDKMLWN